ncbi:MAG TPA: hypothetical protein VGW34_04880 [Allosphingosinicella sp.]|nr:hypothetical protein [Allosphingosinicella sp.]
MSEKGPSRRALLGAAVGLPLLPRHCEERGDEAIQCGGGVSAGLLRSARNDGEWGRALAAFVAAEAAVREMEAATAGYALEEEEALLPAHDAACEAMEMALQRMLFVPAPDLRALGIKFEAAFDQELASSVRNGELRYPAIMQDIIRLPGAERGARVERR